VFDSASLVGRSIALVFGGVSTVPVTGRASEEKQRGDILATHLIQQRKIDRSTKVTLASLRECPSVAFSQIYLSYRNIQEMLTNKKGSTNRVGVMGSSKSAKRSKSGGLEHDVGNLTLIEKKCKPG
jgi:hypothetical protein